MLSFFITFFFAVWTKNSITYADSYQSFIRIIGEKDKMTNEWINKSVKTKKQYIAIASIQYVDVLYANNSKMRCKLMVATRVNRYWCKFFALSLEQK